MARLNVHSITARRGWVSVDVDRYTFTFAADVGPTGCVACTECFSQVHGRRNFHIDPSDTVAKLAREEARATLIATLTQWRAKHPIAVLADLDNVILWLRPDYVMMTRAERAANLAALDQLISEVASTMKMPDANRVLP